MEFNCDNILEISGDVREKLAKNNFYTPDKLDYLDSLIKSIDGSSSYISTTYVDYMFKRIQIQFRQAYLKKRPEEDRYNSLSFYKGELYNILSKFYLKYRAEIISILGLSMYENFFNRALMSGYYFISCIGKNTVIISFS